MTQTNRIQWVEVLVGLMFALEDRPEPLWESELGLGTYGFTPIIQYHYTLPALEQSY